MSFPQVLRTICPPIERGSFKFDGGSRGGGGGGGGLSQYMGEGLKTLSKNTCEGVHLLVKFPAISLQI